MESKVCKECGVDFIPIKKWQVFCCRQHRNDYHLRNQREIIAVGKLFTKEQREALNVKNKSVF